MTFDKRGPCEYCFDGRWVVMEKDGKKVKQKVNDKRTVTGCEKCKVHLCLGACYRLHHKRIRRHLNSTRVTVNPLCSECPF